MADEMRASAARAKSADVAQAYRELARHWETLAHHALALEEKADPWPELDDDRRT